MNIYIDLIRASRKKLLGYLDGLSIEQVNTIPEGFNNNLAWHVGHLLASQQILCYRFSNNEPAIDDEIIDRYKNGTKPESFVDTDEFERLKAYLTTTLDIMEEDIENNIFSQFKAFNTTFFDGLRFESFEEIITYLPVHEGLHLGFCMALKRALIQQGY
ncbi:DinB family protein [Emticicia sp. CRIBPO]|uniref:DinB family protein n=1 Tax=Emticicia sp. CRIBPO TaxID=2683258 RepID=UPI00141248B8|nr:DinB family protein [Emticicia sp. CRIBPO]NBA87795.1 DinB family protein [Emticicia sp. CRIBPO]